MRIPPPPPPGIYSLQDCLILHRTVGSWLENEIQCGKMSFDKSRECLIPLFIVCWVTCVKWPLSKRPKIGFQDQLSLNAGQKYYSAILSTFIKLPFVIKIFVLSIFEWPIYTSFTGSYNQINLTYSDETNGLSHSKSELKKFPSWAMVAQPKTSIRHQPTN